MDISAMISVKAPDARPKTALYLTTVYSDMDTTVAKWIQSHIDASAQVVPRHEFIPNSMSQEEYTRLVVDMMDESKAVAKIAALRYLGYDVKATGQGAKVEKLLPDTPAEGTLKEGDVVVAAQGQEIQTATDFQNLVRRQKPGSQVSLRVQRGDDSFQAMVGTKESDTEPGIALIGIIIKTYLFGHDLPVPIEIDSENIGGPSAGLMFSLGIVDAVRPEGLAKGHKVAGTGTISTDGTVGPVGGVGQKVLGAEAAGAEYFLAPRDNYEAANRAAQRLQVVSVGTLDDAVTFLRKTAER